MVTEIATAWAQRIVPALVVASILGIAGGWVFTRDTVHRHDSRLLALEEWQKETESNRFKKEDGLIEALTRKTTDQWHSDRIKAMEETLILHATKTDAHSDLREHQGAGVRMDDHDRRIDKLEKR